MNREYTGHLAFAVLVLIGGAAAEAQDDVLKAIPNTAFGVAYVKEVDQANTKILKLVRLVGQEAPNVLEMAQLTSGLREGLNTKGSLAVAVLPGIDGAPTAVMFVPTTDFQAMLAQLEPADPSAQVVEVELAGSEAVIAKKGGFAVIAAAKDRSVVEYVLKSNKAIHSQLEPLRAFLDEADAGVVVNQSGVQLGMQQAQAWLGGFQALIGNAGEGAQGTAMGIEVYESLFKAIGKHVTQFAMTAKIDDDGTVRVASRTRVSPESNFAEFVGSAEAPQSNLLKGLPSGPFVVAVGGSTAGNWYQAMMNWSIEMWRETGDNQLNEEQIKKLAEAGAQAIQGVRAMNFAMGIGKDDEPLYGRMHFTVQTDDSNAFLEGYAEAVATMKELAKDGEIPIYGEMELKKFKVDETPALEIAMGFGSIPGADEALIKESFKSAFGGDKLRLYVAAADKTTVVGAYVSKEQLMRALKAVNSGLSEDEQIATTEKLLPADPDWVMYVSPQGAIDFAKSAISAFAPAGVAPVLPQFPTSPPIGFSAKLKAQGLETELVVPAATLKAIGEFSKRVGGGPGNLD